MEVIYSIGVRLGVGIGYIAEKAIRGIEKAGYLKKKITLDDIPIRADDVTKDLVFDAIASMELEPCDVLHAWAGMGLFQFQETKAVKVLERASTHILKQKTILETEYKRLGIPSQPIHRYTIKRNLKEYELAEYIITPSNFSYESFLEHGFPQQKLRKIPFGVDIEKFKPGEKDEKFVVLYAGNPTPRKGLHYLIDAWTKLALKEGELRIMGGDVEVNVPNVKLMGFVMKPEEEYPKASVGCLPSLEEGMALVVLEYMASGLPVVITPNCGYQGIVEDGKEGLIVPARDCKSLSEALLYFYENPDEIRRMGKKAREKAEKYTWENYQKRLVRFYEEVGG